MYVKNVRYAQTIKLESPIKIELFLLLFDTYSLLLTIPMKQFLFYTNWQENDTKNPNKLKTIQSDRQPILATKKKKLNISYMEREVTPISAIGSADPARDSGARGIRNSNCNTAISVNMARVGPNISFI